MTTCYRPTLYVLLGTPGVGKSRLTERVFDPRSVISSDAIRDLVGTPAPDLAGHPTRRLRNRQQKLVAQITEQLLAERVSAGSEIVLDTTGASSMGREAIALARDAGYRVHYLDCQGDTPVEEMLQRQRLRTGSLGLVDDEVVASMAERIDDKVQALSRTSEVLDVSGPQGVERAATLRTELTTITPVDLSPRAGYDRVVVVGDVQSCAAALEQAVTTHQRPNTFWVFVGDLFDRGPDAAGVWQALTSIPAEQRVVLHGNHERNLLVLINDTQRTADLVNGRTRANNPTEQSLVELAGAGIDLQEVADFLRELPRAWAFTLGDGVVRFVCHGGLNGASLQRMLTTDGQLDATAWDAGTGQVRCALGSDALVYGSSSRATTYVGRCDYDHQTIAALAPIDPTAVVQYHGHRSGGRQEQPIAPDAHPGLVTCEARVEQGGHLPVVVHDLHEQADGTSRVDIHLHAHHENRED